MSENIIIKNDGRVVARGQAVVEARQTVEGECRLLASEATAVVTPGEIFAGEARYLGKVRFDCLIAGADGVKSVGAVAEFSDKIVSPEIRAGSVASLTPQIVNVEAALDGGTLKAVAVVDVTLSAPAPSETVCLSRPDDNIFSEKIEIDHKCLCARQTETVYITDSAGAGRAKDILYAVSRAVVTGAEAADGAVKVTGAVYTFIYYTGDDEPAGCMRIVTPFAKSVEIGCPTDGCTAVATALVTGTEATLTDDGRVETAVTLRLEVEAYETCRAEAVSDVFCAENELEVKSERITVCSTEPLVTVIDTVDGQIPIPSDKPGADNVLCVAGVGCDLTSAAVGDGRVTVEGLVGGDIVYYNAEHNSVETFAFRLPFSLPLNIRTDAEKVKVNATVTDVGVRVRREAVFDIKAEIAFTPELCSEKIYTLVSSVTPGAPIARPSATAIVHITGEGETLWQAAKALCCSPDRVKAQNTQSPPYPAGTKLISFCGKKK